MLAAMTRRTFVQTAAALPALGTSAQAQPRKARIAITLDLEMSRNFPTWETTHWDYEKGNLDEAAKRYSVEAARRVKARGGVIHFFVVGRVFEQENVDWLKEIVAAGHKVGNHTYDHVYVLATKPEDVQYRFKRAPWLMRDRPVAEVIGDNIRMCTEAMQQRLGVHPVGFRTPGGFADGIGGRYDVQRMLMDQGYGWISGKYPRHGIDRPEEEYMPAALQAAQPYRYPETGLIEIPMSPVSDINAFRTARWPLDKFMKAVRYGVEWTIRNGAVYDLLAHPSCIGVVDPQFKTFDMICDLVDQAKGAAEITDLDTIARSV